MEETHQVKYWNVWSEVLSVQKNLTHTVLCMKKISKEQAAYGIDFFGKEVPIIIFQHPFVNFNHARFARETCEKPRPSEEALPPPKFGWHPAGQTFELKGVK